MKLKKLSLINCGGFEQVDIQFESDITVIAGVNGIGKSTILRAISTLLSRAMPEFTPSRASALYFTDENIYSKKNSLEAYLSIELGNQLINCGIQRFRETDSQGDHFILLRQADTKTNESTFEEMLKTRTLTGNLEAGEKETRKELSKLQSAPNPPIAVYFTPKRQLPGSPRSLPEAKNFDTSLAYTRALHDREVELREFMHWFRTQEKLGISDSSRLKVIQALRKVIEDLIPEFENLRIQEKPLGFIVDKYGEPFFLHQLSDGERGLLALVFDLTRRLAIANPDCDNPIAKGHALVLIDEIELHLHPKWQRDILNRLRGIFKKCQFIVTTHSPLVLGEVEARSVRFLEYKDEKVTVSTPTEAYGLDANRILEELMGTNIRNKKTEAELSVLFDLIDQENFDLAKQKIKELEVKLGTSEPELTRANSLITFLDGM